MDTASEMIRIDGGSLRWALGASALTASVFYFVAVYILPFRVPSTQNPTIYYAMDAVGTAVIFFAPAFLFSVWLYYELRELRGGERLLQKKPYSRTRAILGEILVGSLLGLGLYSINLWYAKHITSPFDVVLNPMLLGVYLVFALPTHFGRNLMIKMYPERVETIIDVRRVIVIYSLQFGIVVLMYLFLVEMLMLYGVF